MSTRQISDTDEQNERLPTGISGIDTILKGGVFRGGLYIVQGVPGSGKTIFGNQLCFNHAAAGGKALYVTLLAETHSRMLGHMSRLAFFDEALVPDGVAYLGAFRVLEQEGLRGLLDLIRREVRARQTSVVVLDGLAVVGETASSNLELKKFVHELQTQAVFTNCTMFLLTSGLAQPLAFSPEYTMVDGLIEMETRMFGRRADRILQVHKLRGSDFIGGEHSLRIADEGILVFPRVEALLAEPTRDNQADGSKISMGIAPLDEMMGGGPDRHSVSVVLGAAGTGKTTLGLHFLGACSADEPGLLFGFHENPAALRVKARALGLPLEGLLDSQRIEVIWQPATEALLDEVCARLLSAVRQRKVRRLFLDGTDGLEKLSPDKARLEAVLAALCNELRGLGVTTLVTAETELAGIVPGQSLAGLALKGLSPIAENIIVLRLAALRAEIHRLVAVVKARDSRIDLRMRRFEITEGGVVIERDFSTAETVLRELMQQGHLLHSRAAGSDLGGG
jgi:circadian clock protein KaiC